MNSVDPIIAEPISTVQTMINTLIEYGVSYGFQVVGAVIILVLGSMVSGWAAALLMKSFDEKKVDITLARFLASTVRIILLSFAVIIALGKFGITITPFIAALSAMAFGASFAIQGPLSNYGAGISIILSRPFTVGNTITVAGVSGVVDEVKLPCTILVNEENERITIPNSQIVGQILENSSYYKLVRGKIGVAYSDHPEQAIELIQKAIASFPEVAQKPVPQVGIENFGDSSIDISYRFLLPTAQYGVTKSAINLAIYHALIQGNVSIPFPQREVRILSSVESRTVI